MFPDAPLTAIWILQNFLHMHKIQSFLMREDHNPGFSALGPFLNTTASLTTCWKTTVQLVEDLHLVARESVWTLRYESVWVTHNVHPFCHWTKCHLLSVETNSDCQSLGNECVARLDLTFSESTSSKLRCRSQCSIFLHPHSVWGITVTVNAR